MPARALPVLVVLFEYPFQFRFQAASSKFIQYQLPERRVSIAGKRCFGELQYPLHSGSNQVQDGFESDHLPSRLFLVVTFQPFVLQNLIHPRQNIGAGLRSGQLLQFFSDPRFDLPALGQFQALRLP